MSESNAAIEKIANREYAYGFVTDIEEDRIAPGLTEDVVRLISAKKEEPEWLLEWRLKALRHFLEMLEENHTPEWANVDYPAIDCQAITYYAAPKQQVRGYLNEPRRPASRMAKCARQQEPSGRRT